MLISGEKMNEGETEGNVAMSEWLVWAPLNLQKFHDGEPGSFFTVILSVKLRGNLPVFFFPQMQNETETYIPRRNNYQSTQNNLID